MAKDVDGGDGHIGRCDWTKAMEDVNGHKARDKTAARRFDTPDGAQRSSLGSPECPVGICQAPPDGVIDERYLCAARCLSLPLMSGLTWLILVLNDKSFALLQRFPVGTVGCLSSKNRSHIPSAPELCCWTVRQPHQDGNCHCGVAVVDHLERIRPTRPICGFSGSDCASQTHTSKRERKCCAPPTSFDRPRLR